MPLDLESSRTGYAAIVFKASMNHLRHGTLVPSYRCSRVTFAKVFKFSTDCSIMQRAFVYSILLVLIGVTSHSNGTLVACTISNLKYLVPVDSMSAMSTFGVGIEALRSDRTRASVHCKHWSVHATNLSRMVYRSSLWSQY